MPDRIEKLNKDNAGLAWNFRVNPNSCGNHEHYEQYIRFSALDDNRCGRGTTHLFIRNEDGKDRLLGYVTLRAASYIQRYCDHLIGNAALEISELAVSEDFEHQHIGTELVKYAIIMAVELNETNLGIRYITLCADEMAVPFYEKIGFQRVDQYGEIPRENWNIGCVPMFVKLPEQNIS